jgi:hypothetical protein
VFRLHLYSNNKMLSTKTVKELPRLNDTIRINEDAFYKVTEVIWCYDEDDESPDMLPIWGQRVNLRLKRLKV